jgi:hypothetical protein
MLDTSRTGTSSEESIRYPSHRNIFLAGVASHGPTHVAVTDSSLRYSYFVVQRNLRFREIYPTACLSRVALDFAANSYRYP